VNVGPDPNVDINIEQARRQIVRLAEEIAHLSEMDLDPPQYYQEFLQRLLMAIAAPAGAVWLRTPQGNLQLQCHINMQQVGLDATETSRQTHDELLRQAVMRGQAGMVPPQSGLGPTEGNKVAPGNPTNYVILIAPILVDKQVAGLVEVWQDPNRPPDAQRGFLQFMGKMASHASGYTRNHSLRQMVGQQQVWSQLEAFARQIHGSLNPTEVAYLIANEGRRLVECDRVSVGLRYGKRVVVEAISGADVVEKRSNLVQLMRKLFDAVLAWGEKLVYSGTKDDTLPPKVLTALDAFLAESNSKLLVVLPLRDERESESKKPPRSALMMEAFEPATAPEQVVARLEVVGRHSTAALYNAVEHKRIPMRFLWLPLAKVQEGLGGKARAILTLVGAALLILVLCMIFIPYPLRMEAKGQLLPIDRKWLFSRTPTQVAQIKEIRDFVKPGALVSRGQELIRMYDRDLAQKIYDFQLEIDKAEATIREFTKNLKDQGADKGSNLPRELTEARATREFKRQQLTELVRSYNADPQNPGDFWLKAPINGIVLTSDFREKLLGNSVKPSDPLLRFGNVDPRKPKLSEWEIELKIPQKHVGQILAAFNNLKTNELDVDLLLVSRPTQTFKGKLARAKVASEATPNQTDNNEPDPVVLAWVRVEGKDIPKEYQLPPELLLTGTEVHARVRCGNHAMGYSLFYGVWEFLYEKVVFFF
jgi:hypothetical protein